MTPPLAIELLRPSRPRASLRCVAKHGSLRASDADRDQIIDRLRKATAEGRLAAHELEQRVTTALRARTYAELDATVSDLPGAGRMTAPSTAGWAVSTVRAHPALLLLAIPVGMVVAATLVALTTLWAILVVAMFVLGHGGHMHRGPWSYGSRGRFGPTVGRFGPPAGTGRHRRGYSA
jgi:hypothetical protein